MAYDSLPDREALQMLKQMAQRFSGCGYAFDKLDAAIEEIAADLATEEGFENDRYAFDARGELADRYLTSQWGMGWYGSKFGG